MAELTGTPVVYRSLAELQDGLPSSWAEFQADLVDGLADRPPGVELAEDLVAVDLDSHDAETKVEVLKAWDRIECWAAAQKARATAAVAGPEPAQPGADDWPRYEVSAALGLAAGSAHHRIVAARQLTGRLHDTLTALAAGRIRYWYAAHLAEQLADRPDPVAAAVQARVLPRAGRQTFGEFRRAVARALAAADPTTFSQRHQAAARGRKVAHYPADDAMGVLLIEAPITHTADFYDALTSYASRPGQPGQPGGPGGPADDRTLDQRRADTLQTLTGWLRAAPEFPTAHGRRRELGVLIDADTLAGRARHPGELVGAGPIPTELALAWAADAAWRRWTTSPPTGYLLDYGTDLYTPPQALRDYLIARDQTSRFPTSSTPAHRSHLDHAIPFSAGGTTSSANMSALAAHPHRAKHHAGWQLTLHPDGTADWTSPAGHHYQTHPADYHWMRPAPGDPPPSGTPPALPDDVGQSARRLRGEPPDAPHHSEAPDPRDGRELVELPEPSEPRQPVGLPPPTQRSGSVSDPARLQNLSDPPPF